jgi:hypothetical protein
MPNTTIAIKKSGTPSNIPSSLANGELALNYADGKLFYAASNGTVVQFSPSVPSYGTVNANGTLTVAAVTNDVLTILPGSGIGIIAYSSNDTITISAPSVGAAYDKANAANIAAGAAFDGDNVTRIIVNAAFTKANTGTASGGYYQGNNGDLNAAGYGDIFRTHSNTLSSNVYISSGNNSVAAGPISIAVGRILQVNVGARVAIV